MLFMFQDIVNDHVNVHDVFQSLVMCNHNGIVHMWIFNFVCTNFSDWF